ncbi:hypothetical protein RHGRI_025441 [Rhododendron griersonianum]|uniref:Selenoprotein F n=1 Tax=Rhododendron griersonianum TaxID=479676 RepID=A0AAV6ITQ6_9ERIC|nr:hypothetical protein RHGRI_025441 [Rhododendron griersonianum]
MGSLLFYAIVLLAIPLGSRAEQLSSKECESLGFTGLALCSDCNTFAEYVKNQELVSDCLKCCSEDSDDSMSKVWVVVDWIRADPLKPTYFLMLVVETETSLNSISYCFLCTDTMELLHLTEVHLQITYSGAVLEVCMRKLVFYPEIVGFIEEEKEKFPSVKVQYAFNSPPKLIMLDDDGQHKETIRVDNWKREHILQFLREKLKPTSAAI